MKLFLTFLFLCYPGFWLFAQKENHTDTIPRIANIRHEVKDKSIQFTPQVPVLEQIAGAPKAFYSYFWEFGDGTYSREENPKHSYKSPGNYEVKLWATNNYDTGKPPTSRPKKIAVTTYDPSLEDEATMREDLILQRNREPMPEEEMVVVLSYKNYLNYTTNGKLYLFYNEHHYKTDNFEVTDIRAYHHEKRIQDPDFFAHTNTIDPSDRSFIASADVYQAGLRTQVQDSTIKTNLQLTLQDAKDQFRNWETLEFHNMKANEERHLFFNLKTPAEMLKDTSAIISVRGVYVPDANYDNHKVKDMEMEIVTSHDPNKMSSNGTFMNYRLVRFKTLKYKIKFQNNGEGPARTIRLETDIPEMLDKKTLEVTDLYPKCKICPDYEVRYSCLDTTFTDKKAIFTFKNIYLPGSEQKNVKAFDSTKGFLKYKIKFAKDFHKKKTKSRTAIFFDNNDPILTNYSTTRFLPGLSLGIKAGYNAFTDLNNSESYFVGLTLSPYKSYRWYWQVELMNHLHEYDSHTTVSKEIISKRDNLILYEQTTSYSHFQNVDWAVPLLLRYNVNNYIGFGAGVQTLFSLHEKQSQNSLTEHFYEAIEAIGEDFIDNGPINETEVTTHKTTNAFTNFRAGLVIDITAGFARIGPSLGARYVFGRSDDSNYLQLYAIWKF